MMGTIEFNSACFYRYLNVDPEVGQVVYHFACGYAVEDPRIEATA